MMFAAVVGHRSGRATPSLRDAPQRQSMETVDRETIYRSRNAVQTKPATSQCASSRRQLLPSQAQPQALAAVRGQARRATAAR